MFARMLLMGAMLGGCAYNSAVQVTKDKPNPDGFLVNATSTKFIAGANGLAPVSYSDPCKRYAIQNWAIFAKNNTTLTLNANGTLSSIAADLDSTEVPLKVLDLAGQVVERLPDSFFGAKTNTIPPQPGGKVAVYDIVCGDDGHSYLVEQQVIAPGAEPVVKRAVAAPKVSAANNVSLDGS